MSYTPGPWLAVPIPDSPTEIAIEADTQYGKKVIGWVRVPRRRLDGKKAEDQANARLIAAAPDLLGALRITKNVLAAVLTHHASGPDEWNLALRAAEAAIAKVEGRA